MMDWSKEDSGPGKAFEATLNSEEVLKYAARSRSIVGERTVFKNISFCVSLEFPQKVEKARKF